MKTIRTTLSIALVLLSISLTAQSGVPTGELKKIVVYSTESSKILATVKKHRKLRKVLKHIQRKKGFETFVVNKHYADGTVVQETLKSTN